jgi:hypothetical protein
MESKWGHGGQIQNSTHLLPFFWGAQTESEEQGKDEQKALWNPLQTHLLHFVSRGGWKARTHRGVMAGSLACGFHWVHALRATGRPKSHLHQ